MLIKTEKRIPIEFRIGSDAELVFLNGNHPVSLLAVEQIEKEDSLKKELGSDGHIEISEVRPPPSYDPLDIVNSITRIFKDGITNHPKLLKYNWKSGSFVAGQFLGGHIHFQISNKLIQPQTAATIFSNYVASISLLLEDRIDGLKRRTTPNWEGKLYGFKDEIRIKSMTRWEHRTMSSWLPSPYVAASILCLSKVLMSEVLNNPSFKPNIDFSNDVFVEMKTDLVKKEFPNIWVQIEKMKLYPQYKDYIDIIKFLVDNDRTWFPSISMKEAWGLEKPIVEKVEMIDVDSLWDKKDLDKLEQIPLPKYKRINPYASYIKRLDKWKKIHHYEDYIDIGENHP